MLAGAQHQGAENADRVSKQARKRPKKPDTTRSTDYPVKTEDANHTAEAHANLSNAPVHGIDEPLKLDHVSDDGMLWYNQL